MVNIRGPKGVIRNGTDQRLGGLSCQQGPKSFWGIRKKRGLFKSQEAFYYSAEWLCQSVSWGVAFRNREKREMTPLRKRDIFIIERRNTIKEVKKKKGQLGNQTLRPKTSKHLRDKQ